MALSPLSTTGALCSHESQIQNVGKAHNENVWAVFAPLLLM